MHRLFCVILISFIPFSAKSQVITTFAGTGTSSFSGDGVLATAAGIPNPVGGEFDKSGNYYFGDAVNSQRIRKINVAGIITTFAGNGMAGFAGDGGHASAARFDRPHGVKLDTAGNLYIPDQINNRIRKIDISTNIITTIVGTGTGAYFGDGGVATLAHLWNPQDVAVDRFGNIYIADMFNYRIRKVDPSGIISTIAGIGTSGYSGDGGPATVAELGLPSGLAVDDTGNLYIADNSSFANRVRKVDLAGTITTVAGNGSSIYTGDGMLATSAAIVPFRIALDSANNLFITDRYNHRVYKVDNNTKVLYSIAGNGIAGDTGDGAMATTSSLNYPIGVSFDACNNLYITTVGSGIIPGTGRRIRKVTFNPTCSLESLNTKIISKNENISIYPNPANNELHIDNAKPGTKYDMVSIVGAVVHSGTLQAKENSISISNLPPGIYMLAITNEQGLRTVHKIIKE